MKNNRMVDGPLTVPHAGGVRLHAGLFACRRRLRASSRGPAQYSGILRMFVIDQHIGVVPGRGAGLVELLSR